MAASISVSIEAIDTAPRTQPSSDVVFAKFFDVFAKLFDVFGTVQTCFYAFGYIRIHSDAFGKKKCQKKN